MKGATFIIKPRRKTTADPVKALPYLQSNEFREINEAYHANDFTRLSRIFEQQITTTTGNEKAFWMALRVERRIGNYRSPQEHRTIWPDLYAILTERPDHPEVIRMVANLAIQVCVLVENTDELRPMLPVLRPFRHYLSRSYHVRSTLGRLTLKQRRWYSSYRHITLALDSFEAAPDEWKNRLRGYWHYHFAYRARAAVALGWLDKAEADIAQSQAMARARPKGYFAPYDLALAEAALACARGQYADARAALQHAEAQPVIFPRLPEQEVGFLLMAARIARGEGNMRSFDHFCEHARAFCAEHDMPLSAATVRAVMNGAEY